MGWGRAAACPFVLPFAPLVPFSLDLLFSRRPRHRPRAAAAALPHLLPFLSHGLLSLAALHLLVRVGLSLASTVVDLASPATSGSATKGMDAAAVLGGLVPSWNAAVVLVSYLAAAGAVLPGKLVAGLLESSRLAHPRLRLRLLLCRRDRLHRVERPHAAHQPCASAPSFPCRHRPARVCLVILLLIKASRASRASQIQPWWPRSSSLTSCSALPEPADDLRGHPSPHDGGRRRCASPASSSCLPPIPCSTTARWPPWSRDLNLERSLPFVMLFSPPRPSSSRAQVSCWVSIALVNLVAGY